VRRWLRKVILSRMHTLEIRAIKTWEIPTAKLLAIKFKEQLAMEGFTCSAETELVPAINVSETVKGPVYTEEDLIRRTFRAVR
jgi:hypothetical protein